MEKSKSDIKKVMKYFKQAWQDVKIAIPLIFNNIYEFLPALMYSYTILPILSIGTSGIAILLCAISFILVTLLSNYLDVLKQNIFWILSIFVLFIINPFLILIVVYLLLLIILFKARKNSRIYYKHIIDLIIFIVLFFCGLFIHYSLASGLILIAFVYILIKVRKINYILKYFIDILLLLLILMIIVASIIKFHITSIIPEVLIINFLKYIVPIFFSFYLFFIGIDTIKHLISKHKDHTKNKLILYAFIMILVMLILPDFIFATIILDYYFSIYEFKNLLISNEE